MKFKNDGKLKFDSKRHRYYFNNKEMESVTKFISNFHKKFNQKLVAKRIALRDGKNENDIINGWNKNNSESANFGTRVHSFAENYCQYMIGKSNRVYNPRIQKEKEYHNSIKQFWDKHKELTPVDIERKIVVPNWMLAGTVDLIARCNEGYFYVVDWKTSKQINTMNNWGQKMFPPLQHLDDCNFIHYSLQLNLYSYMLEKRYGLKIKGCYIIHLQASKFNEIEIPILRKEIEQMINWRMIRLGR